jgi:hypothetical protein
MAGLHLSPEVQQSFQVAKNFGQNQLDINSIRYFSPSPSHCPARFSVSPPPIPPSPLHHTFSVQLVPFQV